MYIREYMKSPVITVTSDTLIHDAQKIMQEHKIRRLPVVDGKKLVGLITQDRLREVEPSLATTLSIWERTYLLAKMKVKEVMTTNVITITPDSTAEEACVLGQKHNIGTLPVINKGKLVGIITTTDLYRQMTDILGFGKKGTRLYIRNCTRDTIQCSVMEILCQHKTEVLSMFPVTPIGTRQKDFIIHLADGDTYQSIACEVRRLGCEVEIREH